MDSLLSLLVIYEKDFILALDKGNELKELYSVNDFQSVEIESKDKKPAISQTVNFLRDG